MATRRPVYRDNNGAELVRISSGLFSKKQGYNGLCQELAENYFPMRSDFTGPLPIGSDYALDLMDSYPVQAASQLGSAIEAMLRQDDWFRPSSGDADLDKQPAVARGLERIRVVVQSMIRTPHVHFKRSMKTADMDWITFGGGVLSWEESIDRTHPVLKGHHPRDNAWRVNGDGDVDTNFRKLTKTARELCKLADEGRWREPHPDVRKCMARGGNPDTPFEIRHGLQPADGYDYEGKPRGVAFVSCYYDVEHEMTLKESPAPWFNYVIPRWWILGDCPWGFSPVAINTLPDGRMTQALTGLVLEQGEIAISPPIIGAGEVFRNDPNLWTSGFTKVDLSDGRNLQDVMTVVDTAKNMPVGFEMKADMRAMIAEGFLLNKLVLPNTKEMTAFEVNWRTDEFRRAALPFFSPIEDEYHAEVLDGALQMCLQMGYLDRREIPRELAGREAQWSFTSPLNEAEGQKIAAAFRQSVADVASILQIDPTAKTRVAWGQALQDALMGDGAKPSWLPTEEELAQKEAEQKQLNDADVAAGAMQRGASVAADVSNAMITSRNAGLLPPPEAQQ